MLCPPSSGLGHVTTPSAKAKEAEIKEHDFGPRLLRIRHGSKANLWTHLSTFDFCIPANPQELPLISILPPHHRRISCRLLSRNHCSFGSSSHFSTASALNGHEAGISPVTLIIPAFRLDVQ